MMPMPLARTYSDDDDDEETVEETGSVQSSGEDHRNNEMDHNTILANTTPTCAGRTLESLRKLMDIASIEPLLLLFRFAMGICEVTIQSFYMESVCYVESRNDPGYNCSNLTEIQKNQIEKISAKYFSYRGILEYGPPIIFVLIMGQYVDKYGSKFPMLFATLCSTLSSGIYIILAFIPNLNPGLILLASTPLALGGTFVVFLFAAMKHIASNTTIESRSFRIAIAEIIWQIGSPVGLLVAIQILKFFGYKSVFLLAAVLYLFCFIYILFLVTNDKPQNELIPADIVESDSYKCRTTFNLVNVAETFQTCFRKRSGSRRLWLFALLTILFCRFMALFGDYDMAYLYTNKLFNWKGPEYSIYQTTVGAFGIFGSILLSVVSFKLLPWSDPTIGLIGAISSVSGLCIVTLAQFANKGFLMYIGAVFQMFSRLVTIIVRSLTSKIVAKQEVGKVYSLLACIESITPLLASVVFNYLFIFTVDTFPGAVFLLCSSFAFIIVLLFLYLLVSMRGQQLHQEVEGHPAGVES